MNNLFSLQDQIDTQLLRQRILLLWGMVDDVSARYVCERLLYLEYTEPGKPIRLLINSPGGVVTSGFTIYDTMNEISSPVYTHCTGIAASMGAILLSAGEKRFVSDHARIMIHQPSGGIGGPVADIEIQLEEILKIKEQGAAILASNCGQSIDRIKKDFDRDYWMNAREALEYGIVDELWESDRP